MEIPTEIVKDIIVSETNLTFKSDLHIGREPASPDNIVTLFDAPGAGSDSTYEKNTSKKTDRYERASIQVRTRNNSYKDGMNHAQEIVDVLHDRGNFVVNNTFVASITALDNPSLLNWDANDRARFVVNFDIHHSPQS